VTSEIAVAIQSFLTVGFLNAIQQVIGISAKIIVWRFDGRMAFVPEGQADSSQARSAWVAMQRGPVPEGRSKSLSVPQIFVVETELMPLQKRQVFLWKSSGPMMFDLILDVMNGFWQLGDAHSESAITLLPAKVVQLSKSLVNPGR